MFEPTAKGVAGALRRALVDGGALRPVRPAFNGVEVLRDWADVVATEARTVARRDRRSEPRGRSLRGVAFRWVPVLLVLFPPFAVTVLLSSTEPSQSISK